MNDELAPCCGASSLIAWSFAQPEEELACISSMAVGRCLPLYNYSGNHNNRLTMSNKPSAVGVRFNPRDSAEFWLPNFFKDTDDFLIWDDGRNDQQMVG